MWMMQPVTNHCAKSSIAAHQAQEAVGVENKVGLGGGAVTDEGVHAADLEIAGYDLQIVV